MAFCFVCVFDNVSSGRGSKNEREVWRVMCSESSWLLPRVPFLLPFRWPFPVFSVHSWRSRRLHITIDVPLSYACSLCHPRFLGDMLHSAFINQMVQGGNTICPWSMFKTLVLNSFNNNLTEVIQTCSSTVLKNRTGPAPDLWPRSMMMQKAFYDGWVDAAARAAGLPPPAAGCLGNEV